MLGALGQSWLRSVRFSMQAEACESALPAPMGVPFNFCDYRWQTNQYYIKNTDAVIVVVPRGHFCISKGGCLRKQPSIDA